ncbi:ankyrin repeat-containing domain protein [Mycena vulgaris]|nr:ankyrin repeat-containing domain protein [Mycena vulgaris]
MRQPRTQFLGAKSCLTTSTMSKAYFDEHPPELILSLCPSLPTASLSWLILTCRRLHQILQPELDSRITPKLARELLLWAAVSKPHIVARLLSPPYSMHPDPGEDATSSLAQTPLHVAAKAGNIETARLLLDAGANPAAEWDQDAYQPLHLAALNKDRDMMKLLLDHGAPIDSRFGDLGSQSALQCACITGNLRMIKLLLERGANMELRGHFGTALCFAARTGRVNAVRFLLDNGADATVTMSLYILGAEEIPLPHRVSLLYSAMGLRRPISDHWPRKKPLKWAPLPLSGAKKELMALLLIHGASQEAAMETILKHLTALAKEAQHTEQEFLEVIAGMLKEAEDAIPDVLQGRLTHNGQY